jgi:hypothetical protein
VLVIFSVDVYVQLGSAPFDTYCDLFQQLVFFRNNFLSVFMRRRKDSKSERFSFDEVEYEMNKLKVEMKREAQAQKQTFETSN